MGGSRKVDRVQRKGKWRSREQVTAMVLASSLSVFYVYASSYAADLPSPTSSFWWFFGSTTAVAVVLAWWGKWVDAAWHFIIKIVDDDDAPLAEGHDNTHDSSGYLNQDQSHRRRTLEDSLGAAGAIMYALAMIVHLGWVTVFTGGSFYSPYSQLLLGCALLAPYVANGVWSGVLMGVIALISYGCFGYAFDLRPLADHVPSSLVFLTTVLATLISLVTINLRYVAKMVREKA